MVIALDADHLAAVLSDSLTAYLLLVDCSTLKSDRRQRIDTQWRAESWFIHQYIQSIL